MLFSVIIPTFNRRHLLQRTLQSLAAQTCQEYETIIVDDGSTDDTSKFLAGLGDSARVISQENRGPGAARNAAAASARGDYLAFLDSDDVWFPWTLATFATVIADSRPAIVAGRYLDLPDE